MPAARTQLASLVTSFDDLGKEPAVISARGVRHQCTRYSELARLARRFAAELEQREIRKGERVLLLGENDANWIAAFFGCVLRGVVPVPLDVASPATFAERVSLDVSPRLIVADAVWANALSGPIPLIILDQLERQITKNVGAEVEGLAPDDPLQIVFTSGTTATPKGVVHTHRNVLASLLPIENEAAKYRRYQRLVNPIRVLHTLPLSHVFGQFMGLWVPPVIGLEMHYRSRLVASELTATIRQQRISVLAAVPRVLDLMEQHLVRVIPDLPARTAAASGWSAGKKWWHFRDVHRLLGFKFWALVCGGAALSPSSEQFWNALGLVVIQGYGMTETTALVSLNHPFKLARGTVGQVLPGREVRLSDDGEVLVRGETISGITWQDGAMRASESEWLATGDLAEMDSGGSLRFRGRKKDVIVTASGLNIYPGDLEEALEKQPGVKGAAVIESAGTAGPEAVAVLLALNDEAAASAVAKANALLAEFQQMRRWVLWSEPDFPRTSTGKVLRREIARRVEAENAGATATSNGELNLDSLGRVQLQAQIEAQYGVALDDAAMQNVRTESDITNLVKRSSSAESSAPKHRYARWPWSRVMQAIRAVFLEVIAMPLLRFLAKPKILTAAPTTLQGPVLLVANHVTSYDGPFVLYALPKQVRRRVAIAMSGEMILDWRYARNQGNWFFNLLGPLEYWLVTGLFNIFPLPQQSGFRRSFEHAGEAVDRGYSVLIFPEGRRSDNGSLQPFKSGTGLLWKQLGVPAVPVRLDGLGKLKTQQGGWFRSGEIAVSVGHPLELVAGATPEALTEKLQRGVREA